VSALVCAAALFGLAGPAESEADAPGATGVFKVDASNGYSMLVIGYSKRADGRGTVTMFVGREGKAAIYLAPATVTSSLIRANLGDLGRIDLQLHLSGVVKQETSACEKRPLAFEAGTYRGTFEFRGEEGYAEAKATAVHSLIRPLLNFVCGGRGFGEIVGAGPPGARLRLFSRHGGQALRVQANENRPGAPMIYEATLDERLGRLKVARVVEGRVPGDAFSFAGSLRTAVVHPPAPFSGSASFHRRAAPDNRWTGNLGIDFPGRSNVPLTGPAFRATLVHARFTTESHRQRQSRGRSRSASPEILREVLASARHRVGLDGRSANRAP
jgi:hypothetical protein